jgi:thiol-disulfide isomerase/thioredoxin
MKSKLLLGLALLALAVSPVVMAAGQLGDPAAPLHIAEWVKGQAVDLAKLKGKQVVVVEFWATWCPPCRASIPHLTALQKKHKDVVFIGISTEKPDVVKKFVAKMGDQMNYTVAVDNERQTSKGYMDAFGIRGIPHAFIVDKQGRIVWDGHPMANLEKVLDEIVAGKYDLDKARKKSAARAKYEAFRAAIEAGKSEAEIERLGQELEALDAETVDGLPITFTGKRFNAAAARRQIQFSAAMQEYRMAVAKNQSPAELDQLEQKLAAVAPSDFNLAEYKESLVQQKIFVDYFRAASGMGDPKQLTELGRKLGETSIRNGRQLNEWAWILLTDERIKTRDLDLATKLAAAAVDASDGKDANILDTYARALFDSGKTTDAISTQRKAVAMADDADTRKEFEETLQDYISKAKP